MKPNTLFPTTIKGKYSPSTSAYFKNSLRHCFKFLKLFKSLTAYVSKQISDPR